MAEKRINAKKKKKKVTGRNYKALSKQSISKENISFEI
jgi:hypothetical protein